MRELLLAAGLSFAPQIPAVPQQRPGAECDAVVPRAEGERLVPDLDGAGWVLLDAGELDFFYKFYARPGERKVSAMTVAGMQQEGFVETKITWQDGGTIRSFTRGPMARQYDFPLCERAARPGFDLDGVYRALAPRLRR